MYDKLKNYSIQSFKECLLFGFYLFLAHSHKLNLRKNFFTHFLRYLLTFFSVCFHCKICWSLGKVNNTVKTERVNIWIDAQSLCMGLTDCNAPLVYFLKRLMNYCCRICTILCIIFKKLLLIEALCRLLFTKGAHCKPVLSFQSNA